MRVFLTIAVFSFFCSLFVVAAGAQTTAPKLPKSASSASQELKIEFPDIEGWDKSAITRYPNADLGYNINYKSEDAGLVSIYVYNMGLKEIPNDLNHRILKEEMAGVKAAVQTYGNMGYYSDLKELKNETVFLGGKDGKVKALKAVFTYNLQGKPVISEAYVLGHKNYFIKARATYPKVEGETENKALADILLKLESLLTA